MASAVDCVVAQRLARRLVLMAEGYGTRRDTSQGMHRRSVAVSQEQLALMLDARGRAASAESAPEQG